MQRARTKLALAMSYQIWTVLATELPRTGWVRTEDVTSRGKSPVCHCSVLPSRPLSSTAQSDTEHTLGL